MGHSSFGDKLLTQTEPIEAATTSQGPPPRRLVEVGATKTQIFGDEQEAREIYQRYHALHLKDVLEPAFLKSLLSLCASSQWEREPEAAGFREVESPQRAGRVLNLALNRPVMLRWLERVTGCRELAFIQGRVNQTRSEPGHQLHWHDDVIDPPRQVQIIINLSSESFAGGEFAMRPKGGMTLFTHRYTEPGSAMVVRVDKALEHCVRPITAGGPRRVYAAIAAQAATISPELPE